MCSVAAGRRRVEVLVMIVVVFDVRVAAMWTLWILALSTLTMMQLLLLHRK